jgi:alkaline phosphatase D
MSLTRRQFLWNTAGSTVLVAAHRATFHGAFPALPSGLRAQTQLPSLFHHGVASGDPLTDRVILWTRVTPPDERNVTRPIDVQWDVATDDTMSRIVRSGVAQSMPNRDFTVKVDAGGLEPGRPYFYVFTAGGQRSPIGRTKTLPAGAIPRMQLAVVSCANYPAGYFNPYRCLANRDDLDLVIHVGDYIYEFENGVYGDGSGLLRIPEPRREAVTLSDYRVRYATYRSDPDLQDLHARHPFIVVWDDHEFTNDAWRDGASNHNDGEGDWTTRKAAAAKAYLEWMPVREAADGGIRLYRSFRFGTLADLIMLDTRSLRDRQVAQDDIAAITSPARSLLGKEQETWLFDQLRTSARGGTGWRILGQQILFSRFAFPGRPVPLNDTWDGYQGARERVFDFLAAEKIRDIAILTGDLHSSWAFDVPRNPWDGYTASTGAGSLMVELVTPAVSSPPLFADAKIKDTISKLRFLLPHVKYLEGESRGYVLLEITRERLHADWYHVPGVLERSARETRATSYVCERGTARLGAT